MKLVDCKLFEIFTKKCGKYQKTLKNINFLEKTENNQKKRQKKRYSSSKNGKKLKIRFFSKTPKKPTFEPVWS